MGISTIDEPRLGRADLPVKLFAVMAVLVGADLITDYESGISAGHLAIEIAMMTTALAGMALLWRRMRAAREEARLLESDLRAAREEGERWRAEAAELLEGLGVAIDAQFERWQLTPAEREVGLLLLKGLSHREVAQVRDTSEKTVRQQALALYRKAGLSGRAELSAFFLEDLLLPAEQR